MTRSAGIYPAWQKLLLHLLPNAEPLGLSGLTHLPHAQDPTAIAYGLTSFFARYPISEPPAT